MSVNKWQNYQISARVYILLACQPNFLKSALATLAVEDCSCAGDGIQWQAQRHRSEACLVSATLEVPVTWGEPLIGSVLFVSVTYSFLCYNNPYYKFPRDWGLPKKTGDLFHIWNMFFFMFCLFVITFVIGFIEADWGGKRWVTGHLAHQCFTWLYS